MTAAVTEDQQAPGDTLWRVYGIVPAGTTLPKFADSAEGGLSDRHFVVCAHGQVAAVVETADVDRPGQRQDLLAHSDVLNALVESVPVVPIAFGSAFESREQVVEELLAPQEGALVSMLDQLRDHAEFVLRVRYSMDDLLATIVTADREIATLRTQTRDLPDHEGQHARIRLGELVNHAVEAQQAADIDWLSDELDSSVAALQVSGRSPTAGTMSLAFLVHTTRRADFEAVAELCAEAISRRASLELRGPFAAFDFIPEE